MQLLCVFTIISCALCMALAGPEKKIQITPNNDHRGVMSLDSVTFPKIIPSVSYATMVLVYQKGQLGDYGTASMRADYFAFADRANADYESDKILFAQVIVNGAQNVNLAKAIGVNEKFVHPLLFVYPAGSTTAVQFPKDQPYRIDTMARFLAKHTAFQMKMKGTLKTFDALTAKFVDANDGEKQSVIVEAEGALSGLSTPEDRSSGEFYVKVMKEFQSAGGMKYVNSEVRRLSDIFKGPKVSPSEREDIQAKVNILLHFQSLVRKDTQIELQQQDL